MSVSHIVSTLTTNQKPSAFNLIVDGGAPYYAIGVTEICVLRSSLGFPRLKHYDPMFSSLAQYKSWKYGEGSNLREERPILGSVNLNCRSDLGRSVVIHHLIIAGSSQWLICRNVTCACNQLRIDGHRVQFSFVNGVQDYLSIAEGDTHDYILLNRFNTAPSSAFAHNRSVAALVGHSISVSCLVVACSLK